MAELYVLANVDAEGKFESFPKGGGSSTKERVKAYDSLASAKRGKRHHSGEITQVIPVQYIREKLRKTQEEYEEVSERFEEYDNHEDMEYRDQLEEVILTLEVMLKEVVE